LELIKAGKPFAGLPLEPLLMTYPSLPQSRSKTTFAVGTDLWEVEAYPLEAHAEMFKRVVMSV